MVKYWLRLDFFPGDTLPTHQNGAKYRHHMDDELGITPSYVAHCTRIDNPSGDPRIEVDQRESLRVFELQSYL
jgi:hypothetical protein